MKPFSLALRVAVNVILTGTLLITLLIALCYWVLDHELDLRAKNEVLIKFEQISNGLNDDIDIRQGRVWQHVATDTVAGHQDLALKAIDSQTGAIVLRAGALEEAPVQLRAQEFQAWQGPSGTEYLTGRKTVQVPGGPTLLLQLTLDRSADQHLLAAFLHSALTAIPVLLLLIGFAGWLVAHQGLRPLSRFRSLAAKVSARDLSPRIRTQSLPKELKALAHSLNLMLHRLDTDVQRLSQFSDDAAHELRAPLNNLLGKAQVVLARKRDSDQYRDALASSVEELERLNRIVTDMLFLAQVSHADMALNFETLSLDEEARRVCSFLSILADERDIQLLIEGTATLSGDRLMIQRALSNLLSNAVRHSSPGRPIQVCVSSAQEHEVRITVTNEGADIPQEDLPHLFERFYRVGKRLNGGTGLGLAIVRSIMSLHGGSASVISGAGRTTFTLTFATQP